MGRLLYLNPLYSALINNGYKNTAIEFYRQNEDFYSPLARNAIKSMLGLETEMNIDLSYKAYKRIRF